ncbi:MAG: hypothetical protein ACPHRO_03505, partial [Nannocystaceae bacterium]
MAKCLYLLGFPKYVLAGHFARGKRVLVAAPSTVDGVEKLLEAGASEVLVVGSEHEFPAQVQARPDGIPDLPLHD